MQGPLSLKNRMLSTPLINISKASTPIRTRIVSNNPPLNSTPISQLKYSNVERNNCQNKQNLNSLNQTNLLESKKEFDKNVESQNQKSNGFSKINNFTEQRPKCSSPEIKFTSFMRQSNKGLNLSPIMALNRKMSQGPVRIQGFRSFTPGYVKRADSPLNISKQKVDESLLKSNSMIFQQKEKVPLISASNSNSNLRKSNSFASLFQKRSNTPTRLGSMAFNSLSNQSKNPLESSKMKQSLTFHQDNKFLSQMLCGNDGKKIIKQSPLQYKPSDNFTENNQLMCFNNHNKLAKYRVIHSQGDCELQLSDYVYCSKCAIDLVQKGFSVQEITNQKIIQNDHRVMSLHTSPGQKNFHSLNKNSNNLRQSGSLQTKFLQFKPSMNNNYQSMQKIKTSQRIKQRLMGQLSQIQTFKKMINQKCMTEIQEIDCYYNSMISYIQQQRIKDKQTVQAMQKEISSRLLNNQKVQSFDMLQRKFQNSLGKIQTLLKTKNFNTMMMKQLQEIQSELNYQQQKSQYKDQQIMNLLQDPSKRILYFDSSIQQQFDQFVSYLDNNGKLKYLTYQQINTKNSMHSNINNKSLIVGKNNALRFSFQKALKSQNQKKMFLQTQMNPLQQESQQQYEQNSFNQENNHIMMGELNSNNQLTEMDLEDPSQRPFRTLFAEQDQIIQQTQEQQQNGKTTIYSPNFKSI